MRRIAVEDRRGDLTTKASSILGDILGRDYRAQQIRAASDPVIRWPQAALAIKRGGERVSAFDGSTDRSWARKRPSSSPETIP